MISSNQAVQRLVGRFLEATALFGFTVSVSKTEMENVRFLGGALSNDGSMHLEICSRIVQAAEAFERFERRLWNSSGVRLMTKVAVYKASCVVVD